MRCLVTGAGGAIGGHLVQVLLANGHSVRAVDVKPAVQWWQRHSLADNLTLCDLAIPADANRAMRGGIEWVFDLAERMGGMGYITTHKVDCAESIEIGINLLRAAVRHKVQRFFFSSSACAYPTHVQQKTDGVLQLKEDDAWPARPESGYGFSKLYMEELCQHYAEEHGLEVRVARFHNVFGPYSSWDDGKEKAPAALCRKVAIAKKTSPPTISIWGDGKQMRSYLYVADCVNGIMKLMESNYDKPVNIGSDECVSVDELVDMIEEIAEVTVDRIYCDGPEGVRGRNADISLAKEVLDWAPQYPLIEGMTALYRWIEPKVHIYASNAYSAPLVPTNE